ncbi:MAG TPA: HD domain-containing protein [Acidimicrobiales bacterium]|nr:HD domain-containing protein [Acidimicrobiales bacterium]
MNDGGGRRAAGGDAGPDAIGAPHDERANERNRRWASTMDGHPGSGIRFAHVDSDARRGVGRSTARLDRPAREQLERERLWPGATLATGAGHREVPEEPDPWRTCFERDRDRILHDTSFRRLAGKTQVFVFPDDHQRTRLTHALEVAQVATGVARACGLNVALTEAIALGHDCGHGPGGHASEDALSPYLDGGFDHAPWGADVSLAPLNLCRETLDGIRNHSWSRPAPATPEGEVVSWADRIAYVCHDFEDAVRSGIVTTDALPALVRERCGDRRGHQLGTFIDALVTTVLATGRIAMADDEAEALAAFRASNYEHIYLRPNSVTQGRAVVAVLRALVEYFSDRPNLIPDGTGGNSALTGGEPAAIRAAVAYVAGMTDRFAFTRAVALLGWDPDKLPAGVGTSARF